MRPDLGDVAGLYETMLKVGSGKQRKVWLRDNKSCVSNMVFNQQSTLYMLRALDIGQGVLRIAIV